MGRIWLRLEVSIHQTSKLGKNERKRNKKRKRGDDKKRKKVVIK
jgi:hypothetical protein